ncbi:hypothetical protein [Caulobacter sp. CCUG 60055]|uniref:SecDF P1 head subdomain-containing protein n=1 Tax=Caulobacter sp. CCUG 60055 TaxID=2100090 RepID=UPI001FA6E065|nr:hypothetical protein [Caulobacter sp. CCUG 60055]MBQ1541955.1 hypothetical protein [Caulobacteraceae bacterium]
MTTGLAAGAARPRRNGARLARRSAVLLLVLTAACASASPDPTRPIAPPQAEAPSRLSIGGVAFGPGDVESSSLVFDAEQRPAVGVRFSRSGQDRFQRAMAALGAGRPMPIVVDGQLVSAPILRELIPSGSVQITGAFSLDEARTIAEKIGGGRAPPASQVTAETRR